MSDTPPTQTLTVDPGTPPASPPPVGPSSEDIAKAVADAIKDQPGIDDKVQKLINDAVTAAQQNATRAIEERQAAKSEAQAALDRVSALERQLRNAKVMGAARDAGAHNPERVAQILADVDDTKIGDTLKALQDTDPYLFRDPNAGRPTSRTPSPNITMTGATTTTTTDPGLQELAKALRHMTGT